jgi:hypothetical protein
MESSSDDARSTAFQDVKPWDGTGRATRIGAVSECRALLSPRLCMTQGGRCADRFMINQWVCHPLFCKVKSKRFSFSSCQYVQDVLYKNRLG